MARRRPATTHGVVVVDKPAGVTSHDVVGMMRRRFGERQVGHAGTLDPDATGVLVVAVGKATRLLRFVEKTRKGYTGEVVLGTSTSTLDSAGDIVGTFDMSGVTIERGPSGRRRATWSATSNRSRRWCRRSRSTASACTNWPGRGSRSNERRRPVTIHRFEVLGWAEPGVLSIDVECSAGTYIRTLADDLGRLLGGGAHLRHLRRTARRGVHAGRGSPTRRVRTAPGRDRRPGAPRRRSR